jgi:hypothetical protein
MCGNGGVGLSNCGLRDFGLALQVSGFLCFYSLEENLAFHNRLKNDSVSFMTKVQLEPRFQPRSIILNGVSHL